MSKFSEKCKEILAENGTNVYRLSTSSSLERTTLQRMVTGKRLPNIDFVKAFCNTLRLSKIEEEELLELYKIEFMGEDAYLNEKHIIELLKHLRELEDTEEKSDSSPIISIEPSKITLSSNTASNANDTELLLHFILDQEFSSTKTGKIYTNLPAEAFSFVHKLKLLYATYRKKISIQHLIQFQMNASLSHKNLKKLNHLLPLFMSNTLKYDVYYYYSRLTDNDREHMLFPYYVITSDYVLIISEDNQTSILLSDPLIIRQYMDKFKNVCKIARSLFQTNNLMEHVWNSYKNNFTETNENIFFLHYNPCFLNLISHQDFISNVTKFLTGLHTLAEQYSQLAKKNATRKNVAFYLDEGLAEFAENGKYYGQIAVLFPSMNPQQRANALTHFNSKPPGYAHRMLRSEFITLPKHLYFELQGTKILQIIRIKGLKDIDFVTITEKSICEAFYHFFESLQDSKYIYDFQDEVQFIDHSIEKIKTDFLI